jgi:SAM-dependent methyltransferase
VSFVRSAHHVAVAQLACLSARDPPARAANSVRAILEVPMSTQPKRPADVARTFATVAPPDQPDRRRPAFEVFEGFAISSVLAGLEMGGLLAKLEADGLSEEVVRDRDPAAAAMLAATLRYAAQRGLVSQVNGAFHLTDRGREICQDKGYLVWLVGGYGEPLRRIGALTTGAARYGRDHVRDGEWVAGGAALLGRADVVPYAMDLLAGTGFHHMLDIGCGNARFLLLACQRFGATGVGVDLSPEACQLAERAVAEAGMSERVQIALGDAADLRKIPRLAETDLVVTFFLLHEILAAGRDVLVRYLADLAGQLPAGANLLIAEVEPPTSAGPERFTPEFTYVHAMMGQILYSAEDWQSALTEGGFAVRAVVRGGIPGGLVMLCEKPVP